MFQKHKMNYQPIPLPYRAGKSNAEMKSGAEAFYTEIKQRRSFCLAVKRMPFVSRKWAYCAYLYSLSSYDFERVTGEAAYCYNANTAETLFKITSTTTD